MRAPAWGVAGLAIVLVARILIPGAPAMYEGPAVIAPYRFCTPPNNLTSTNQKPADGGGDLLAAGDASQLGSHSTADQQVLTFFPKGALQAAGATRYHVQITPQCDHPPVPPARNRLVGNAYDISVLGQPGDLPIGNFKAPAQVLLRTPPVQYTSVLTYYDNRWHATQWGQQGDIANITINHAGVVAALDDGSANAPGKPPDKRAPGLVTIVEIVLLAAAIGVVVAAIIVQRRRGPDEGEDAVEP